MLILFLFYCAASKFNPIKRHPMSFRNPDAVPALDCSVSGPLPDKIFLWRSQPGGTKGRWQIPENRNLYQTVGWHDAGGSVRRASNLESAKQLHRFSDLRTRAIKAVLFSEVTGVEKDRRCVLVKFSSASLPRDSHRRRSFLAKARTIVVG
jgi:hypothetical protein